MNAAVLGPQRLKPTLIEAVTRLKVEGQIATITAGWQEREPDDAELHQHLHERSYNLRLYERAERIFHADRELSVALHARQETLRQVQELYRVRLAHALAAARALDGRHETSALIDEQRAGAIDALRALDAEHLARCQKVHREFEQKWSTATRELVARERESIAQVLRDSGALAVAGGHVAVLANRLRLFGVLDLLGQKPLIAWSAGAMACSERIILFHDNPPQGPGNAELLEGGMGVLPGIVPLPHAHRRLRLNDQERVSLMARRFAPARCLALDDGAQLFLEEGVWSSPSGVRRLDAAGTVVEEAA